MFFIKILHTVLIIVFLSCLVENRSYNTGLIFYNLENYQTYLPPTISVSRGRGLTNFKYSPRGSIWSTFGRPCECTKSLCGCCVGIKVKQYNFDQKICANVSYAPIKDEIELEVLLNDTSSAKYGLAARNPSPLCVPIMMGIPMSMCIQMYNIGIQGDNLNMCMDFLVRLASTELFEMHFQCMKMGLQGISWVGPDGQPVIPANEGKIKIKSSIESEEYYDESATSEDNEIISKEGDQMNNKVLNEIQEEDLNKAEEEIDYNDIVVEVIDTFKEQEKVEENAIEYNKKISEKEQPMESERLKSPDTGNKSEFQNILSTKGINISGETKNPNEELVSQEDEENEMSSMEKNNTSIIKMDTNTMKDTHLIEKTSEINDREIESDFIKQNVKGTVINHVEFENKENNKNRTENASFEDLINSPEIAKEKIDSLDMLSMGHMENEDSMNESMTLIDKKIMEITTEHIYDQHEFQKFEQFEMPINNTNQKFNNSFERLPQPLETSSEHSMAITLRPTVSVATATTSENGIDSIDNGLITASIMTTTTTTTTAKFTGNNNDGGENSADEGNNDDDDDNSQENYSHYDDEESIEFESETTQNEIETNDTTITLTGATKVAMLIATNDLNNENIIESTTTITPNISASNETNSNNKEQYEENEDDDFTEYDKDKNEEGVVSKKYEDEEYEDYDTTTIATSNTLKPSAISDTHTANENTKITTNKSQMSYTDTLTTEATNNINTIIIADHLALTSSRMSQFNYIPSAPVITASSVSSTTTAIPLSLARKFFALHQLQQQLQQQQQKQQHYYH